MVDSLIENPAVLHGRVYLNALEIFKMLHNITKV